MKNILLLSDSHSYIDDRICFYAEQADEIWHAGDFGTLSVVNELKNIKPLRAVWGNIDGNEIKQLFPEVLLFQCEEVKVMMTHIGGYPEKYAVGIRDRIVQEAPQVFISGHSHILKAMYDKKLKTLHLNPGACGRTGWHTMRTMVRFRIESTEIKDLEIIELGIR